MSAHDTIVEMFEEYIKQHEELTVKKKKVASGRARKALQSIAVACKERRKECIEFVKTL